LHSAVRFRAFLAVGVYSLASFALRLASTLDRPAAAPPRADASLPRGMRAEDPALADKQLSPPGQGLHVASELRRTISSVSATSSASAFFTAAPAEVTLHHYRLWRESIAADKPIVELTCPPVDPEPERSEALSQADVAVSGALLAPCELTVVCKERDGLLADVTDFLTARRLNIITARIFTLPNSSVMDIFHLHDVDSILRSDDVAQQIYEQLYRLVAQSRRVRSSASDSGSEPSVHLRLVPDSAGTSRAATIGDESIGGASSEDQKETAAPSAAQNVARASMARSFSNLAIVDMDKRTEVEAVRRARADDIKRMVKGDKLYMYSSESLNRYCFEFRVSDNTKTLRWGKNSSANLWDCVGVYYGISNSSVFRKLEKSGRRVDPEWLCFSLVGKEGSTIDLAASNEAMVDTWVMGLQTLCQGQPTVLFAPVRSLTFGGILAERGRMKIRAAATQKNVTPREFVLDAARNAGASALGQMEDRMQTAEASRDALGAQLEEKIECIRKLQAEVDRANDRESVLKTKLRETQQAWETKFDELSLIDLIGGGSFSEMWRAKWRGSDVACKMLKAQEASDEAVRELYGEVTVLSKLRHPNIVLFMTACPRPPHLCIVTEFCHGGNMFNAIRKPSWRELLRHNDFVSMARDTARGMLYLHSSRIVHRDLKSQNVLLDRTVEAGRPNVKIADFGLSRMYNGQSGTNPGGVMTSETGTYRWMAPEVIRHEPYSEKIDVYSFGVLIWEFFSCEIPFANMTPIQAAFAVADKAARPSAVSEWARNNPPPPAWAILIERCWSAHAHDRPGFDQVVEVLDEMEKTDPNRVPTFWTRFARTQNQQPRRMNSFGESFGSGGFLGSRFAGSPPMWTSHMMSMSPSD